MVSRTNFSYLYIYDRVIISTVARFMNIYIRLFFRFVIFSTKFVILLVMLLLPCRCELRIRRSAGS